MGSHPAAVALLFSVELTDRALAGWRRPVWLALGDRAIFHEEWAGLARWAPCGYMTAWYEASQRRGQTRTTIS
jgi:hypothetical protein